MHVISFVVHFRFLGSTAMKPEHSPVHVRRDTYCWVFDYIVVLIAGKIRATLRGPLMLSSSKTFIAEKLLPFWRCKDQFPFLLLLKFSSMVLIISFPTFVASAKRGAKYAWIFSNFSLYPSMWPNETRSLQS